MTTSLSVAEKTSLTRRLIEAFGRDMEFFYANTHKDIVLEFPFASSNGFPTKVEGIDKVRPHFASVTTILKGWEPYDIRVSPMADANVFLMQYRGRCQGRYRLYDQQYCSLFGYKEDKLILMKEYWDTLLFERAWGNAGDAETAAKGSA
jgi:ketosteroid isomerase-like protein